MRLSEVALEYRKTLHMRQKEYDKFQLEKKSFDATNVIKLQSELREKNTEISYLESQLKDKDEIIKKLRREMAMANESNDQTYALIDSIWGRYDTDNSGALDKLETLNFLNEFMQLKGKPTVTVDQFNVFFKKFDENGDGQIEKGEMANFVRRFIQGQTAVRMKNQEANLTPEERITQLE
jgi:Ca2+-binding EF-hand superfamily protein